MNKQQDIRRFSECLTSLEKYFGKPLDDSEKRIYWRALEDLPIELVELATDLAFKRLKWMPKAAELRELVEGNAQDHTEAGWLLFKKAVEKAGYYTSLWVEDPCLAAAIVGTFGGWIQATEAMHNLSDEMIASKRKEYLSNYRLAQRRPAREAKHYLVGAHEANNRNSVSTWSRGKFPDGRFTQKVGIVTSEGVTLLEMSFSAYTGELTDEARAMLEGYSYRAVLEAEAERKKLPSAGGWRRGMLRAVEPETDEAVDLDAAIGQCEDKQEREKLIALAKTLRGSSERQSELTLAGSISS